jgi:ATP-binding cassette subfamily B protein
MQDQPESVKLKTKRTLQLNRALRFVWKSAKGWTIANAVLIVVQGVLPLLPLYLMKLMVDAVTAGLAAPDKWVAFKHVLLLGVLMGAVTLFASLIRSIAGLVSEWQAYIVTDHMNDVLLAKSVEVDLEYYEPNSKPPLDPSVSLMVWRRLARAQSRCWP